MIIKNNFHYLKFLKINFNNIIDNKVRLIRIRFLRFINWIKWIKKLSGLFNIC